MDRFFKFSFTLCVLSPIISSFVLADIVNCNGSWTNKPCKASVTATIPEKPLDPRLAAPDYADKKNILSVASAYAVQLSALDINFPLEALSEFCLETSHTIARCQKRFSELREQYEGVVKTALARKALPPTVAVSSSSASSVAVRENNAVVIHQPLIIERRNRYDREDRWRRGHGRDRSPRRDFQQNSSVPTETPRTLGDDILGRGITAKKPNREISPNGSEERQLNGTSQSSQELPSSTFLGGSSH